MLARSYQPTWCQILHHRLAEGHVDHQQDGALIQLANERRWLSTQRPMSGRDRWPTTNGSISCTMMA
jgi:hypothetical protein